MNENDIKKLITDNMNCKFLAENEEIWNQSLCKVSFIPIDYSIGAIRYYLEWMKDSFEYVFDSSIIIYENNRCVGIWTFQLRKGLEGWSIGSNASELISPLFVEDISRETMNKLNSKCFQLLIKICNIFDIKSWNGVTFVLEAGVNKWHKQIMEHSGDIINYEHIMYVNLNKTHEEIWNSFRRRYKSYINKSSKHWNVNIIDKYDLEMFEKYKNYHHKIAGRVTRSQKTWDMQLSALKNEEAFMIFVEDKNQNLIGAAYFLKSKSECLYLSGVFNRELFNLPVSHIVQYKAIIYSKEIGLKYYRIGERFYNNGKHKPSQKEIDIANFKEGFQTNTYINLYTQLNLASISSKNENEGGNKVFNGCL